MFISSYIMCFFYFFFFFNDTATTEIYTLSLHDALPILHWCWAPARQGMTWRRISARSEEHTSELQSHVNLVCRLLLEKKKKKEKRLTSYKKKKTNNRTKKTKK